jgi:TRAP-type mannitol/chloroaromatic compound transport system permease small subunit
VSVALTITRIIDEISRRVGLVAVWLVLFSALLSAFNAIFRYSIGAMISLERSIGGGVFGGMVALYTNYSSGLSESVWYMFGGMVMLGGAWTLKMNEHVRVDLLYGSISERARTWIDLLGGLFFLMPLCIMLIYFTWPWFVQSWNINEMSPNAGDLVRWPVKLLLPIGFGLMILQGISEIIKRVASLMHVTDEEFAYEKPLQ